MTFRVARRSGNGTTTLSLSGRIRADHLREIRGQLNAPCDRFAFDLKEVTLVDSDTVRFLGLCELEGVRLANCAHYIREWISRERNMGRLCECDEKFGFQ